ncbi:hypothetical protein Ancab_029424 [Ancistrocladus abbreviatus]
MDINTNLSKSSNGSRGQNSIVRSNIMEVFRSCSIREEDDEEALVWAPLKKLPTYNRLRKGILTSSQGMGDQIDISDLGFHEKKKLIDKLICQVEEDNETVRIDIPTNEVRFEHLSIEVEAYVGSRGLPTFINYITNKVEVI